MSVVSLLLFVSARTLHQPLRASRKYCAWASPVWSYLLPVAAEISAASLLIGSAIEDCCSPLVRSTRRPLGSSAGCFTSWIFATRGYTPWQSSRETEISLVRITHSKKRFIVLKAFICSYLFLYICLLGTAKADQGR